MDKQELGKMLAQRYNQHKKGFANCSIMLFGIEYSSAIKNGNYTAKDILEASKIGKNYEADLRKGIKLADFVKIKMDNE